MLHSALRPGGFLLLHETTQNFESVVGMWGFLREFWESKESDTRDFGPLLGVESLEQLLRTHGFESKDVLDADSLPCREQGVVSCLNSLETLLGGSTAVAASFVRKERELANAGANTPTAQAVERTVETLESDIKRVLGLGESHQLDERLRLIDHGIDSLMGVELVQKLARWRAHIDDLGAETTSVKIIGYSAGAAIVHRLARVGTFAIDGSHISHLAGLDLRLDAGDESVSSWPMLALDARRGVRPSCR
jgi:aryl carrier-like protein